MNELIIGIGANAAFAVILLLLRRVAHAFGERRPAVRVVALAVSSLLFLVGNCVYAAYDPNTAQYVFVASTIILVFGWWWEIRHFWSLGISGVGSAGSDGERYDRALALCSNSFDFLGVGASKLISRRDAFEAAIQRCHRNGRPVRFLLCSPDNEELIRMAQQAGRSRTEYQETVRHSLRVLKDLRDDRARNIAVRFYEDLPVFRLMFANDDVCLVSHYVFGEGDGSDFPDLYIRRNVGRRDTESIYYGFKQYFDSVWKRANAWDFKSNLE